MNFCIYIPASKFHSALENESSEVEGTTCTEAISLGPQLVEIDEASGASVGTWRLTELTVYYRNIIPGVLVFEVMQNLGHQQ